MSRLLYSNELLEALCNAFGPSGCEDGVASLIEEQIAPFCNDISRDRLGNVIAKLSFGEGERTRVMLSAHMDEVGFMVTEVCDNGYLRFANVGGISPTVLSGTHVTVGDMNSSVNGVISSKAVHHKDKEERKKITPVDKLYIDVGCDNATDAKEYADVGTFAAFAPNYCRFGNGGKMICSKALDDRLGCALLIELIRSTNQAPPEYPVELYFCFTVREEVGLSGAQVAAQTIRPDVAVVLETTAVGDILGADESARVAVLGEGGVISLMDNGTIYDRRLVDGALGLAKANGIKAQIKKYVSGGNDAKHIQQSGTGVRVLALSAPTRYLHSPTCVASFDDYLAMLALLGKLILWKGMDKNYADNT